MGEPREQGRERQAREEREKGTAALVAHAAYVGAAYPTDVKNVEEGYIRASNPEELEKYLKLSQEYDREVLRLYQEAFKALEGGRRWEEVLQEFLEKQTELSLQYAQRELQLNIQLSPEAKADLEQALKHLKEDPDFEHHPQMAQLVRIIETLLQKSK